MRSVSGLLLICRGILDRFRLLVFLDDDKRLLPLPFVPFQRSCNRVEPV